MRYFLYIIFLVPLIFTTGPASASDDCIECHEKETPGIVDYWKKSSHSAKNIGCSDCHGKDKEANHNRQTIVDAVKCGSCHKNALASHRLSKHAIGLRAGKACTRNMEKTPEQEKSCSFCHEPGSAVPFFNVECAMFLAQSPEMQRQGCNACHMVEVRCDTCHTKHGTDLSLAKSPDTCGVCHMGPDHPQLEMWELSPHGVIYRHGDRDAAPSCITCHMRKGSHNVSAGISTGLPAGTEHIRKQEREFMLGICSGCHTKGLAKRNLDDGDRIEEQGRVLVEEAKGIIEGLQKEGLLLAGMDKRPPHPLFGDAFVIGPHMLYEDLSFVESLFFRMKQFYYTSSFKGVFHQNPDYAHWYGNAPMKLALSEIKSEAALLRRVNTLRQRLDNLGPLTGKAAGEVEEMKRRLREINERRLKGEMSERDYRESKDRILREKGL